MKTVAITYNLMLLIRAAEAVAELSRRDKIQIAVEYEMTERDPRYTTEEEFRDYVESQYPSSRCPGEFERQLEQAVWAQREEEVRKELESFEKQVDTNKIIKDYVSYFKANNVPYFLAEFVDAGYDVDKPTRYAESGFIRTKGPAAAETAETVAWIVPDFEEDPPEPVLDIPVSVRTLKKEIYDRMQA